MTYELDVGVELPCLLLRVMSSLLKRASFSLAWIPLKEETSCAHGAKELIPLLLRAAEVTASLVVIGVLSGKVREARKE